MTHNRFIQYFIDSFQELGKVSWPTKNKAVNICVLVISFVLIATAFIAAIDYLFHQGYAYLLTFSAN